MREAWESMDTSTSLSALLLATATALLFSACADEPFRCLPCAVATDCAEGSRCTVGWCVQDGEDPERCPRNGAFFAAGTPSTGSSTGAGSTAASTSGSTSGGVASTGTTTSGSGSATTASGTTSSSSTVATASSGTITLGTTNGGSTGSCARFGTTGGGVQPCAASAPLPRTPSPSPEWATWRLPDGPELACTHALSGCDGLGEDGDWRFASSQACPASGLPVTLRASVDALTGLVWLSSFNDSRWSNSLSEQESRDACATEDNGNHEVRRASVMEALTLLDCGAIRADHFRPGIATARGSRTRVWASSAEGDFIVDGSSCEVAAAQSSAAGTLCVVERVGSTVRAPVGPLFRTSGDETTDTFTGLIWASDTLGVEPQLDGEGALDHCNRRGLACGRWRLPSFIELATLMPWDRQAWPAPFTQMNGRYWSSTPAPTRPGSLLTWSANPLGSSAQARDRGTARVLCVRGP